MLYFPYWNILTLNFIKKVLPAFSDGLKGMTGADPDRLTRLTEVVQIFRKKMGQSFILKQNEYFKNVPNFCLLSAALYKLNALANFVDSCPRPRPSSKLHALDDFVWFTS